MLPAVALHQLAADPQPKTDPRHSALGRGGAAKAELEHLLDLVVRHAEAAVGDGPRHGPGSLPRGQPNLDPSAIGGGVRRVVDEVGKHLMHLVVVGDGPRQGAGAGAHVDAGAGLPAEPAYGEDAFDDVTERHLGGLRRSRRTVGPAAVGDAGDHALEAPAVALHDLDVLALPGGELAGGALEQQGEQRVHHRQRRAHLVPHVRLAFACGLTASVR